MKSERVIRELCLLAFVLFAGVGCAAGSDGTDGLYSLVDSTKEPAGKNCKAGGQRIDTGEDTNGNGKLDSDEILTTSYVCDGTDGTDGSNGSNGSNGGNGSNGAEGNDALLALVKVSTEAPGSNCTQGGQRIDTGIDSNGNATLDKGEIDSTSYICDGSVAADGLKSLIDITDEAVGANCQNGGQRIDTGVDANANGMLEPAEIDNTNYICNSGYVLDMTPTTGSFVQDVSPGWANKGYSFTAAIDFTISAADWYLTLPNGGEITARVYDNSGVIVATGTIATGDGTEQWYRSVIDYTFSAGQVYTVSFHNTMSGSCTMDRMDSPTYGYGVGNYVTGLQHVSDLNNGDNQPEAFPTTSNSWAPFQRLILAFASP